MSQAPQANGSGAGAAGTAAPGVAALMGERPIDCLPLKVTLRAFWGMIKSYWGCKDSLKSWAIGAVRIASSRGACLA